MLSLSIPHIWLQQYKMRENHVYMFIITIRNNEASRTSQSNTLFVILLATLLVITFPNFAAFFTYACIYG